MTTAILTFGYAGSGKGTALNVAEEHDIPTITMGDVVRTRARRAHSISGNAEELDDVDNNIVGPYATQMREIHGKDVMAQLTVDEIHRTNLTDADTIMIDGVRGAAELEVMEDAFDTTVAIYIEADRETRLGRLQERGRDASESTMTLDELEERDEREEQWGMAELTEDELYDVKIVNEESLDTFYSTVEDVLADAVPHLSETSA